MKIFVLSAVFTVVAVFGSLTEAAVSNQWQEALVEPTPHTWEKLKKSKRYNYRKLKKVAFDNDRVIKHRWNAIMAMAYIGHKSSIKDLEKAIQDKQWFLRDAGLQALRYVSPDRAGKWAAVLIKDKALVVRTTAVRTLRKLRNPKVADLLWRELYSKRNFRLGQSLWVRKHMVQALAEMGRKKDVSKFVRLLDDKDTDLHRPAMAALENLTGEKLGAPHEPLAHRRNYWRRWWKQQQVN